MRLAVISALAMCLFAAASQAAQPFLPPYVTLPAAVSPPNPDQSSYEIYGEAEFHPNPAVDEPTVQRGKHWHASTGFQGLPEDIERTAIWAKIKPAFLKQGWTVVAEYPEGGFSATLHLQRPGIDAWTDISVFGADDIRIDVVETGQPPSLPPLPAPAATPERVNAERGDFPYLPPLPGSKYQSGQQETGPMMITLPGSDQAEVVATGSILKVYAAPEGLSNLLFAIAYKTALANAGWSLIDVSQGMHQSDAMITAHYAKNGRDIWAELHGTPGGYSIRVADVGARDVGSELDRLCHIALYGVLFDFDKATIKPESDAVLARAAAALAKEGTAHIEVQGHTDAIGTDAYNQTLSEARARSVMVWLTQHGIAADRLTAKGYGKTVPVADNGSDEGRAKNRRVEIAKIGCQPKR